jgi:hypothetical protein
MKATRSLHHALLSREGVLFWQRRAEARSICFGRENLESVAATVLFERLASDLSRGSFPLEAAGAETDGAEPAARSICFGR